MNKFLYSILLVLALMLTMSALLPSGRDKFILIYPIFLLITTIFAVLPAFIRALDKMLYRKYNQDSYSAEKNRVEELQKIIDKLSVNKALTDKEKQELDEAREEKSKIKLLEINYIFEEQVIINNNKHKSYSSKIFFIVMLIISINIYFIYDFVVNSVELETPLEIPPSFFIIRLLALTPLILLYVRYTNLSKISLILCEEYQHKKCTSLLLDSYRSHNNAEKEYKDIFREGLKSLLSNSADKISKHTSDEGLMKWLKILSTMKDKGGIVKETIKKSYNHK